MNPHLEAIDEPQRQAIALLGPLTQARAMYLAGGTAVALHLGHRRSVDLDWFSPVAIHDPLQLAQEFRNESVSFDIDSVDRGTLHGRVLNVRVSFLEYQYPLLNPTESWSENGGQLASLDDLAAMKLVAAAQRGTKKDFVDIHALGKEFSLRQMILAYQRKYSMADVSRILYALTYFEDAEHDLMPRMIHAANWETIKQTIRAWVKDLAS